MYTATAIIYCNLQILKQLQYCKKRFTSSWVHAHLEDSPLLNVMWLRIAYFGIEWGFHSTVEPLYNEVLGITNNFHYHSNSEIHEKKNSIKRNLLIEDMFSCQSLGSSLYRGFTVYPRTFRAHCTPRGSYCKGRKEHLGTSIAG